MKGFIAALLVFACTSELLAQTPFSSFDLSLGADRIVNDNDLLQNWNPTTGFTLDARSPYYVGELEAGTRFVYFNEQQFQDSAFRSFYLFIGWSYPFQLGENVTLSPGFRIGNHFMWQDNSREYFGDAGGEPFVFQRNESQFAYEVQVRLKYQIREKLYVHISGSYNRTPINIPLELGYLSAGVSRTFSTPGWLRRFVE